MSDHHPNPFAPTARLLRQFAGIWIVFFGTIAAWQGLYHHRTGLATALAVLAVTIGPIGLAWPRAIKPIFIGWMTLAYPIGWTVSRLVLGTLFYGMFTPLALFFRLTRRDELGLKRAPDAGTYWLSKPRMTDKARYLRQS
jgi:hypothetical protein